MSSNPLSAEKQAHVKQLVSSALPEVTETVLNSYVAVVARKPQDAIDILASTSKNTATRNSAEKVTSEVMRYLLFSN
jgi:hypothetical protein